MQRTCEVPGELFGNMTSSVATVCNVSCPSRRPVHASHTDSSKRHPQFERTNRLATVRLLNRTRMAARNTYLANLNPAGPSLSS